MIKKQDGFSLIELLIVMALFVIVLAISSDTFTLILRQSAQQSKTAETQIERIVGLETLRTDIEHAGYGLPWAFQSGINYNEAAAAPASNHNDAPSDIPRALRIGNDTEMYSSDYLAIKATNVGRNDASQRWSYIITGSNPKTWASDNLENGNKVIVIKPKAGEATLRQLVMSGTFFATYSSSAFPAGFSPTEPLEMFLIYGVDPDTDPLRMPFNRTDYYISSTVERPQSCHPNTGVLVKSNIRQSDGARETFPILDCVADFQVIFYRDTNNDGTIESYNDNLAGLTAQQIREQVKEVRVYILTHEGQRDPGYTYPNATIEIRDQNFGLIKNFDLSATIGGNWQNYRWKIITLAIKPKNLQ
jgi:prepilin-type N-terminal cleavage/methylation domain-containing protein